MERVRKPFQGVLNIIRFNWHYYVIGLGMVLTMVFTGYFCEKPYNIFIYTSCIMVIGLISISLLASLYIYDISPLYQLNWVNQNNQESLIVNINAGFDETSHLLHKKFKKAELASLDFYNPAKHTEVSIKRARKAYPPFPKTKQIETSDTKLSNNSVDKIFVILSAHEIRNETERIIFFKELFRILKPGGQIYVTEHLRDISNFLVYNFGFFHFYSKGLWIKTFIKANLKIRQEIKITPFISTFILNKDGNSL